MKINEIKNENIVMKPQIQSENLIKSSKIQSQKDIIHISESKRENNLLDRKINTDKVFVNK